jgi:MFS-type transporter involved in bile tolerance (Atg22 family)
MVTVQRFTGLLAACWLLFALPAGNAFAQAYQVSSARPATIESIRETVQQG